MHPKAAFNVAACDVISAPRCMDQNGTAIASGQVRFSTSLAPLTMSDAHGCLIERIFIALPAI